MSKKQKQNGPGRAVAWHALSIKEALSLAKSRPGGLTEQEVRKQVQLYGSNQLTHSEVSPFWKIILSQISSPLVYVLLAAGAISWAVGHQLEVVIILIAIGLNTAVGFWQEYKADRALSRLTNLLQRFATVERDGRQQRVEAHQLVVGDVMVLHAGDKVAADARLLQMHRLQVNEASLTGESISIDKHTDPVPADAGVGDRRNMVFAGTIVTHGTGRALVVAVGDETQLGTIAGLVRETRQDRTPLQTQLIGLSRFLTILVLGISVFIFLIGTLYSISGSELLVTVAALAVAAIPEGLLVSLTIVLVIGMQRLLRRRALVRKLLAAETLGSVTVVCSDKTGTLTKGEMQVARIVVHGETHDHNHGQKHTLEYEEQHLAVLKAGMLCNDAYIRNPQDDLKEWDVVGDQTDAALLLAGVQAGFDRERLQKELFRLDEIPFDERYKFMATLHHGGGKEHTVYMKGAPETVLSMCQSARALGKTLRMTANVQAQLREEYQQMAKQGLRVLAVASKRVPANSESFDDMRIDRDNPEFTDLVFDGWVGLKDPVRPEVRQVFATMSAAGIRPMIITGDHPETVRAVAAELGWQVPADAMKTGQELNDLTPEQLVPFVQQTQIFARVEPKHKVRIIEALRLSGEVVAMFGDGVNDAPALKAADIAVVVNSGTDIAKETADLILLDNHFGVITAAIREGRTMFDNIRRIFLFLVCDSFAEVGIITLAIIMRLPMPLTAIQILWMNLLSDTLPNLSLTLEDAQEGVMRRRPRSKGERIVNKEVRSLIFITTGAAVLAGFLCYVTVLKMTGDVALARTVCFTMVALDSMFYVFSIRRLGEPLWRTGFFQNKPLLAAISFTVSAQVLVVYWPPLQSVFATVGMRLFDWMLVLAFGILQITVIEIAKIGLRARLAPEEQTV